MRRGDKVFASVGGGIIALILLSIAAYLTHIIVAIGAAVSDATVSTGYEILLVAGTLIPPIGIIHGIGVWFGAW